MHVNIQKVGCIGARNISLLEQKDLELIGEELVKKDYVILTGNAQGADQSYARGGNKINPSKVILYLPWKSYEKHVIHPQNIIFTADEATWEIQELARKHHPFWENLSLGVKKLMIRNAQIISQSDIVIAKIDLSKKGGGGTGHGIRIAKTLKKQIYLIKDYLTKKQLLNDLLR